LNFSQFKRYKSILILVTIAGLMILTIWIRSLIALSINLPDYMTFSYPDIWYNFRQIELMIHNYPVYNWFDPMTGYPTGKSIDWGPFLPFVIATLSIITGMTSRQDMMYLSSWVIPLFAALMIPVTYSIGKIFWDWKTGILAAGLLSVTSGTYFLISTFGHVDHHILELFFGALFCLTYIVTLKYSKQHPPSVSFQRATLIFLGLSLLTSLIYFAGFLTMPTVIIFGVVVALYTFFQFLIDHAANILDTSLLFTNIVVFAFILVFTAMFGLHQAGLSLQQYSMAHIFVILFIIGETLVMYSLSKWLDRNIGRYVLAVGGFCAVVILSILTIGHGALYKEIMLFGRITEIRTIAEAQPWSLDLAFFSFNVMLILSLFGFVILLYHVYTKKREEHLFFLIWTLIIFALTTQYLRFEAYFAVNVTLLSSLSIVTGLTMGLASFGIPGYRFPLRGHAVTETHKDIPTAKKKRKNQGESGKTIKVSTTLEKLKKSRVAGVFIIAVILITTVISVELSVQRDLDYSLKPNLIINNNWVETSEWLDSHTPNPGIDYLGVYQEDNFSYPKSAYGILSWWEQGHYILFIGKRIPITNPFQDHLFSSRIAGFYLSGSEADSIRILQSDGARYVITDTSIATDKLWGLVAINGSSGNLSLYMKSFFKTNLKNPGSLMQLEDKLPPYFHTTIARLQIFDGSMQIPDEVLYLEYHNEARNGVTSPMVTNDRLLNVTDAMNAIGKFEKQPHGDSEAIIVGQYLRPVEPVPALQHFRMVHESRGNSPNTMYDIFGVANLKQVKVFEFVQGAHVKGEGIIQLNVVTNTGREFLYQQESVNGEFIVPYSTVNNPNEVHANGRYHIIGTTREIDVTEDDVLKGLVVDS